MNMTKVYSVTNVTVGDTPEKIAHPNWFILKEMMDHGIVSLLTNVKKRKKKKQRKKKKISLGKEKQKQKLKKCHVLLIILLHKCL